MEDIKAEAALGLAKTAPPTAVGFTAVLGVIDWGVALLIVSFLFTIFQFYTSIRRWIDYKRDRKKLLSARAKEESSNGSE